MKTQFVVDEKPELVFITETWLTDSTDTSSLPIPEYNIVCKNELLQHMVASVRTSRMLLYSQFWAK